MYTSDSFKHLKFNPAKRNIIKNYPVLESIIPDVPRGTNEDDEDKDDEGFEVRLEFRIDYDKWLDNIVRYIVALHDPLSPLFRDFPTLTRRQEEAAKVADIDDEDVFKVLQESSDEFVVEIIHNFLQKEVRSLLWAKIQSNEFVFWEYVRRMMKYSKEDDDSVIKSKMSEELDKVSARLETYYTQFYGDDNLKTKAEKVRRMSSPESIGNV